MRYTVVGAGAIGGTVGAHLVRGGESVLFVDHDLAHVRAMQQHGLTIRGFAETFSVPVQATTPDALRPQRGRGRDGRPWQEVTKQLRVLGPAALEAALPPPCQLIIDATARPR
jgi:hypothetical protein